MCYADTYEDKMMNIAVINKFCRERGTVKKNIKEMYESCVALRAVASTDGMTADWVHLPYDFLAAVSNDIINKVRGVNRVVYDISSKPPATIEWE